MLQKLNIISPIFNEEKNIDNFFNGLKIEKDRLSRNYDINFIFVDDGSTDKSKQILKNLEKDNDFVKVVFFTKIHSFLEVFKSCLNYFKVIKTNSGFNNQSEFFFIQ